MKPHSATIEIKATKHYVGQDGSLLLSLWIKSQTVSLNRNESKWSCSFLSVTPFPPIEVINKQINK